MTTLRLLARKPSIPTTTAWYLADLAEARGKQELFIKQSPQRLKVLREHALIESAVSSNRIEGVTIEQSRVKAVILGQSLLTDRDEEEIRGYRNALKLIHEQTEKLSVSEKTIQELHRLSRANIGDAGRYKIKDSDIRKASRRACSGSLQNGFRSANTRRDARPNQTVERYP